MAKKNKYTHPHSDKPKVLKEGNAVIASFLGNEHHCVVVEVVDKDVYKLRSTTGTVLGKVKWGQHLIEYCPWHIIRGL